MFKPRSVIALLCLAWVGSANAQAVPDASLIADRYVAAMQRKGYAFLSKGELASRRAQVAAFVAKYSPQPLDEHTRLALLDGIDRCIDRLYSSPAGKVDYSNGFGSGGEEWMYLNDRDYFLTFQYHLWVALTQPQLAPPDAQRRDTQQQWMRQYLTALPYRANQETPPREGMRNDEVRPWALAQLDKDFADPLSLLSQPMPDAGFAGLQDRLKQLSNGISSDLHDMEVAALTSRFTSRQDPAARYGESYSGRLPFDDTVVDLWGNGPSLCFASNADFRGQHGELASSDAYDVIRCLEMATKPAPAPASREMETWLAKERRGELTLEGSTLRAVRGAKIAPLTLKNWLDADQLTDDQLRAVIRDAGTDRMSVARLPAMNGPHSGTRTDGEFFIVVLNPENRLAVVNLHNFEFGQIMFWCRPRATNAKASTMPATQPQ